MIRQLIREMLQESVSPTSKAADQGLAVCTVGDPKTAGSLMIYDPAIIDASLAGDETGDGFGAQNIFDTLYENPAVRAGVTWQIGDTPCNAAKIILRAASAEGSGMGPAAYEAAMWYTGGLAPDRTEVHSSAANVWKRYYARPDVEKLPFDDVENPETPPPDDDCEMHEERPYLNYSYSLPREPAGLAKMEAAHELCMQKCKELGIENLQYGLMLLFRGLFQARYSEETV